MPLLVAEAVASSWFVGRDCPSSSFRLHSNRSSSVVLVTARQKQHHAAQQPCRRSDMGADSVMLHLLAKITDCKDIVNLNPGRQQTQIEPFQLTVPQFQ